jgi:hypothetical protein
LWIKDRCTLRAAAQASNYQMLLSLRAKMKVVGGCDPKSFESETYRYGMRVEMEAESLDS